MYDCRDQVVIRGVAESPIRPFLDCWGLFCTVQLFYRQFCALFYFFCLFCCLCVLQLAFSSCTHIGGPSSSTLISLSFFFLSNLQSSVTGVWQCQHIYPQWVKLQQSLLIHPLKIHAGLIGFHIHQLRFPISSDFPPPLRGHCVDC